MRGLAELRGLDGLDSLDLPIPLALKAFAGKTAMRVIRRNAFRAVKNSVNGSPAKRAAALQKANEEGLKLARARAVRRAIHNHAVRQPQWVR